MNMLSASESVLQAFELIIPFVPEIEPYLADPTISDICVNCNGTVWVERLNGEMNFIGKDILDQRKLMFALQRIARQAGEEIGDSNPSFDASLPDGSRIAAVLSPISPGAMTVTIRKFYRQYFSLDHLVELGSLPVLAADVLRSAMKEAANILISGMPGSGKTSLQNALLNELDPNRDRVLVIEESAELQIDHPNMTRYECRTTSEKPVTIRDLVKFALRHNPKRLVIGEIRGAEAMDLLDAMNTGNAGSMSTIHANSALSALTKLSNLALRANADIPYDAIQAQIADVITYVAHMRRKGERRYLAHLVRINAYNFGARAYEYDSIYEGEPKE